MNTFSLLADSGDDRVLRTADDRFQLSGQVWDESTNGIYVHVRAFMADYGHWHLLLDGGGCLLTEEAILIEDAGEDSGDEVARALRDRVHKRRVELTGDGQWLERTGDVRSVLRGLDGRLELRAKAYTDENHAEGESMLELRGNVADFGHFDLSLQAYGRLLPGSVTGSTSGDAYNRFRNELARRSVELD
jgi:hypothetical protein